MLNDTYLLPSQCCEILSCSQHVLLRAINEGRLTAIRLNARVIRIRASDLKTFIESCTIRDSDLVAELLNEVVASK